MDNKELRLECFKHLSSIHRSQFDERRKYEWKIVFASLAFYVASIAAKLSSHIIMPNAWIIWSSFVILAIICSIYLFRIHMANRKNLTFAENAEKAIEYIVKGKDASAVDIFFFTADDGLKKIIGGSSPCFN